MRVALIGGTGFVGRYLVDALLTARHEVSLLVRSGSELKLENISRCHVVHGDLASQSALEQTLSNCDAVIYNVGILREFPSLGVTFEALQYEGLVGVVNAAKKCAVRRLLLMSANGVTPTGTAYQQSKYRAEQHALQSGLAATIFRPSVIFGNPRGSMEFASQLYRDMVRPPLPAVGFFTGWNPAKGQILMSPVQIEDVAQSFVLALDDATTVGRTVTLGGPEILSWTEILVRIGKSVGRRKLIVPMPIGIMKLAASALDRLPAFPVTRDQLVMLESGNTAEPVELETLIGRKARAFSAENLAYLRQTSR